MRTGARYVPYTNKSLTDHSHALLEEAQKAAVNGDAQGMIEALAGSGFLDGLVGRLTAQWRCQFGEAEIRDIVAHSVDKAFDAISQGKPVRHLGGWLWKIATNEMNDCWQNDHRSRVDVADIDRRYASATPVTENERAEIDRHRDLCRNEAIRLARRLLPQIGEGQVREVITLVIDAAEQGVPHLPASQIAESLGIGADAARTLLSRGFRRLRRAAQKEGIEWPDGMAPDDLDDLDAFHDHVGQQEDVGEQEDCSDAE
jgi:DNA-directed RNA polymerase specialized sigma24 family protein